MARNWLRLDPTRTGLIRRAFLGQMNKRFNRLRAEVWKLVAVQDAFDLVPPEPPTILYDPNQPREPAGSSEGGQFASEGGGEIGKAVLTYTKVEDEVKEEDIELTYVNINRALRLGTPLSERQADVVAKIDRALAAESSVLKEPLLLYRGFGLGKGTSMLKEGHLTSDKAFISTSADYQKVEEFAAARVVMVIRASPGDRALDVSKMADVPEEKEFLLPRGTKFMIDGIKETKSGLTRISVHIVSQPTHNLLTNASYKIFAFHTIDSKLKAFNTWFKEQVDHGILEVSRTTRPWMSKFVESAYKKGAIRAYMDSHVELGKPQEYYLGSREQFLRSTFDVPERVSKLRLLGTRAFEELKGITSGMSGRISRVLADGLANGKGPYEIARTMSKTIGDIQRKRANVLARTEIIHAHAEGQLDSFEDLGVEEVGMDVEWSTAEDELVCPECEEYSGRVMKVKEARGLIPLHPNCRCAWIPVLRKKRQVA